MLNFFLVYCAIIVGSTTGSLSRLKSGKLITYFSLFFLLICNCLTFFNYSVKLNEHYVNTTDFLDAIKTNLDKALGK